MIRKIKNINNLEDKINYKFKDINLLEEALTHSSFKNNTKSNLSGIKSKSGGFFVVKTKI